MNVNIDEVISNFDSTKSKAIKTLIYNNRNSKVIFKSSAYYMYENGKFIILSGLLPALKKCFYKDFDSLKILKMSQSKNTGDGYGRFFGSMRGSLIHEQLNDFLLFDKPNFLKKYNSIHPWVIRIFEIIKQKNWIPIVSEFDIFDEKLKIGTSVDMICLSKDSGKIIALEFKTGYKNYFENKQGYMKGCLKNIMSLSLKNCATLQILTAILFIIKNHKIEIDNIEGHVIQINDNELNSYEISNDFIVKHGKSIYDNLYKSRISEIKLRRKKKKDDKEKKNRTIQKIKKTPKKRIK